MGQNPLHIDTLPGSGRGREGGSVSSPWVRRADLIIDKACANSSSVAGRYRTGQQSETLSFHP